MKYEWEDDWNGLDWACLFFNLADSDDNYDFELAKVLINNNKLKKYA